ncbi:MAG: hypothetical protein VB036_10615 [Propionicimonas sp.]|nr:hypothetical protein [Propionicimonas sp.]
MTQTPQGWPDNRPPTGWSPTPLGSGGVPTGPDPRQPLGAPRPSSTTIGDYAPPRSKAPWFIGLAVAVVAVLIAVGATLPPDFFGAPAASPSPSQSASPALPGQPFGSSDERLQGRWEVRNHRWTASGVEVELWLAVDSGSLDFSFVAFSNTDQDAEVIYPSPGADGPAFDLNPVNAGEERTGWLFFPIQHADLTLILSEGWGQSQLSALVIPA